MSNFIFTFNNIRKEFERVLSHDYEVVNCLDYALNAASFDFQTKKYLINRVDVDLSLKKALRLTEIFNDLNIKATFFVRLHANEYNPFSFESYRILKFILDNGHEIGYHSEVVDQAYIWNENASDCLSRDLKVLNSILGIEVKGTAGHGGMTGLNNLDFWKGHLSKDFGLVYEAYDWFAQCFYVSDSEWTQWKCYDKGVLVKNDRRSLSEHAADKHPLIYSLIHPDTYFDNHFYE